MTITIGLWIVPAAITILSWVLAYRKDRGDPDVGSLWAYAAAGATISSWIFYACLWLML